MAYMDQAKFICIDISDVCGHGTTENEAFDRYRANDGEEDINQLVWFEVKEIEVSVSIRKKTVTETKITRK